MGVGCLGSLKASNFKSEVVTLVLCKLKGDGNDGLILIFVSMLKSPISLHVKLMSRGVWNMILGIDPESTVMVLLYSVSLTYHLAMTNSPDN